MKILRLEAENVKRLEAVEIEPDGSLVIIGGENGAGKSSVLDSIVYALAGKGAICDEPLRRGAEHGHVVCELDDIVVRRTFTPNGGGQLTVSNKEGARYQSPQGMLDTLWNALAIDPLAFTRMTTREQADTLRELVGIDTAAVDAQYDEAFALRRDRKRDLKGREAHLAALGTIDEEPGEPVDVAELAAELQERIAHRAAWEVAAEELKRLRAQMEACQEEYRRTTALAGELLDKCWPVEEVEEALRTAQERNGRIEKANTIHAAVLSVDTKAAEVAEAEGRLEAIQLAKRAQIEDAEFPIDGLGFDDEGTVTLNGLPFAQASSAEQLRTSVAMGLAMHPQLKVLLIHDGSLLDATSLGMVAEMAEEAEAQVFVERVGTGDPTAVVIEEGRVRGQLTPEEQADLGLGSS